MSEQNGSTPNPPCPICGKPSLGYRFAMAMNVQPESCSKECARVLAQILVTTDITKLLAQLVAQGAQKAGPVTPDGQPINLADLTRKA